MPERRWDTDTVGHGVGSAAAAAPDLRRLLDASAAPDWIAEQPEVHLLPALEEMLAASDQLRLRSTQVESDGGVVLDLEWTAPGRASARAVRVAVYRVLAAVAELSTHVQEHPGPEFTLVTGILDGDTAWRGHGHLVRVRVRLPGGAPPSHAPGPG